jgi:LEA14-like dessication related protein
MMRRISLLVLVLGSLALAGCGSGKIRRVSDPAVSVQQLTVQADGQWVVELRLQNYSSIPMRFDTVKVDVQIGDQAAGTLQATPALSVGPESADVVRVPFNPPSAARIVVADALAGRRAVPYTLKGTASAAPEDAKVRTFDVDTRNTLNPVPGLDGVLR